ncbi:MAG: 3-keto-disaccharide hydrolase [Verrucomicrobiales bacterium]
MPGLLLAEGGKHDAEPVVEGAEVIQLIDGKSLKWWKAPSDRWSVEDGVITGDTGGTALKAPEWLYTTRRFGDFTFTCELRLTGSRKPNSGVYFRVNPIQYKGRRNEVTYEAAAGYEFDAVPGRHCGSLGDWYARPSLRVFADPAVIGRVYRENGWNRMTIRARGKRLEYWLNGEKIIDYVDKDPKGSRNGLIGLQIHDKAVMKVELRKARILPEQGG